MLILCILVTLTVGCATYQDRVNMPAVMAPAYAPASASALVFDPPLLSYAPVPDMSRSDRSPSAFYGYEQATTEGLYIYQRDTQRGGKYPDYFDRTTRATRATTTYR